jgi:hypothetical protein
MEPDGRGEVPEIEARNPEHGSTGLTNWQRLNLAASMLLLVALVVAASLGMKASGPPGSTSPSAQGTDTPTPDPTEGPTLAPTIEPIVFDGVYGPGIFTRGTDSCSPPFFGAAFNGTLTVINNGTTIDIGESQTRRSTGSVNTLTNIGTYTGTGVVGTSAATWTVVITFSRTTANVAESLRLTARGDCGTTFTTNQPLLKK